MSTDSASPPMLVNLPPVFNVYQDQMTTLSQGLALWNPSPPKEIYDKVSIGDVGYLHEGSFVCMFNVMLPWNHGSNRTLGEPEPYESLDCGPFANTIKRQFDGVKHCSRYVSAETIAGNFQVMTPDDVEGVVYRFRNRGALLSLPNGGRHEDVIRAQPFEDYIKDHVDSWFTWAQKNRLGVKRMEDLILVSGCTLVTSWAAAAFVDDAMDAEVSLASRTFNNGGASFVWSNIRGSVLYHNSRFEPFRGEQKSTIAQDQCVFVRGFRVTENKMQVIRVSSVPEYDDPNIGVVDTTGSPIKNENPQLSLYRHPTLQRSGDSCNTSCTTFLGDDPLIVGSSSSLDTIGPPLNHQNSQLFPYPSSISLPSNGGQYDASLLTSPSYISSIVVQNYIAEIHHEDAFAEDTTGITHGNDLSLIENLESLTVDTEDSLLENNPSLLNGNGPIISRDLPEANQMPVTSERKEGRFGLEVGSQLFGRMTRAGFASLLGTRNPPPRPVVPSSVTELRPSAPVSLQPNINEESPVPLSSRPPSRPRSRTMPSIHLRKKSPQDSIHRRRTEARPQQPPQSLRSSSPHHHRDEPLRPRLAAPHSKKHDRSASISTSPEHIRVLNSTLKQVLAESPEFRILVVGKRGSGKSSLINATFRVNMSAAPGIGSDINLPFRPDDNHHLIVHEYSVLGPGDSQGLRTIRDFIINRTDPNRAPAERLHAIWICIPTSDAIGGSIGVGVDEILNIRRAPVVVAFTKSDLAFPHISGSESGHYQYQDRTRTRAYAQCEQLCRSLFRRKARDVPAELVSVMPQYSALMNNLIVTSDRLIMGSRVGPSSRPSSQRAKPRITPAPLAWSVALRASRDITIQASIENGRSRYWRSLWSSLDFADQPLKSCVNIIHVDVIEIWNLFDRHKYLSSSQFKISMSHVVKDLAVPAGGATSSDWNVSGDKLSDWVYDVYRGSQENVRCVMGYIVDLTVILDDVFRTTGGNVSESAVLKVMGTHVRSGCKDNIHRDIRSFVTETFAIRFAVPQKDLVLEKIIELIRQYCSSPNS